MPSILDHAPDVGALTNDQCLALLESIEAERAALDALQQRTLATLQQRDTSEKNWIADEVACVLRLSPRTAPGMLRDARALVERLPRTLEQLADATVSLRHARVLIDATRSLDDATTRAVETRALCRAGGSTVSGFRRTVRRAVAALDRRRVDERHREAALERRIVCTPQDDGMSEIWALLPTDAAARVMARLDRHAASTRGRDDRTADQRRVDGLVELVDPTGHGARTGTGTGTGPSVHVTVALSTLLDLDDHPGDLSGHGPVPAAVARRIAADPTGTWRRLVTDNLGGLIGVSRAYRPPPAMREHVIARDRTCRFPGCGRAARTSEIDHLTAWDDGGATVPANLHALCGRHHHLKHEAPGWQVTRAPDGVTTWRTPSGRLIEVDPDTYDDPAAEHPADDDGVAAPTVAVRPDRARQAGPTSAACASATV